MSRPVLFCSAAYPAPFKGLHVALRSLAVLRTRFPEITLRVAGAHRLLGIHRDGYIVWINRQIERLGIQRNIVWLGPLNAAQVAEEMRTAAAIVIPTYIENCCATMQEAMMVGVPVVASYTGGLPSIARDEESALFFPIGDEIMCAHQIERVLTDRELAARLSKVGRQIAIERNESERLIADQLDIYGQVIAESRSEQAKHL